MNAPGKSAWWSEVCLASMQAGRSVEAAFAAADAADARVLKEGRAAKQQAESLLEHVIRALPEGARTFDRRQVDTDSVASARASLRALLGENLQLLPAEAQAYLREAGEPAELEPQPITTKEGGAQ